MQLDGELQARNQSKRLYSNAFSAFVKVFKNEGLNGLQKGLTTAYAYQIILNGFRLGLYDPLRDSLQSGVDSIAGQAQTLPVLVKIASGATTGLVGAFFASPLFLIKTVRVLLR
jgi:solute carrier family 25 protein 34/35